MPQPQRKRNGQPAKTTRGKVRDKKRKYRKPTYVPSEHDETILKPLLEYIKGGLPEEQSCEIVGINYGTFRGWKLAFPHIPAAIKKARAEALSERLNQIRHAGLGGQEYETQEIITKAKDGSITKKLIRKLAKPDWYAAAWWASRQYVDQFGSDRAALEKTMRLLLKQGQSQAEQQRRGPDVDGGAGPSGLGAGTGRPGPPHGDDSE